MKPIDKGPITLTDPGAQLATAPLVARFHLSCEKSENRAKFALPRRKEFP
jgi:hypothetical protein